MYLPRRHYLALAGIGEQLFKTLQRRDQVPLFGAGLREIISGGSTEAEVVRRAEQVDASGYMAAEAVMLAIADRFVTQGSFSRESAKRFLSSRPELTIPGIRRVEGGEEIWIGAYDTETKGGMITRGTDGATHHVPSFGTMGTLDEVMNEIRDSFARWDAEGRSINLLNITPLVRHAQNEARRIGYDGSLLLRDREG